ncbi:DNA starvation/stationary phase protection protein Dps [Paracoccus rhizosphaerae]|uniref:DNA starvation/stationary phase protection protein Dps n=1 Tax=Paracoccus rhizosphaerae TaxID=1133347 RepID=A0ABV6CK27_9RHOB|nr:DNA starvation/stationary phase protection protein Dps [Paracoccus rhizosphaerae]
MRKQEASMAVNVKGLEDNARKTSIETLNARVSDSIALGLAVKQAHWNMKGPNFIAVHEFLDAVYARVLAHTDVMAERVQILDGRAMGTAEVVKDSTTLKPYPTDVTKVQDHLKELCDRIRDHGEKVRKAIDSTDDSGDADTADLLTGVSRELDKDLWFLESHLE